MRVSKSKIIGGIYVVVGVVIIIVAFHMPSGSGKGSVSVATSTVKSLAGVSSVVATSSALAPVAVLRTATGAEKSFSIDPRDTNFSWRLSNTAPATVIQKSNQEIHTLLGELHKGKYPDYDIYLQLGQEYEILGEGKQAYENYRTAGALSPSQGVAMNDIGSLMAHLGALHTAQNAYAQSVARQPAVSLFWVSYLTFLTQYEPKATGTPAVFAQARKITHDNTNVLIIEAQWLASIGRNKEAISDWKIVRARVSGEQQRAIDERIAKLNARA
ncbi:MAG TPA: hypothetical protein ENI56_01270 [Candidatus Kaiserbacteria bacterium]|nr:hypothetical protein [Candidatus Kaiserbacteria bacterium]